MKTTNVWQIFNASNFKGKVCIFACLRGQVSKFWNTANYSYFTIYLPRNTSHVFSCSRYRPAGRRLTSTSFRCSVLRAGQRSFEWAGTKGEKKTSRGIRNAKRRGFLQQEARRMIHRLDCVITRHKAENIQASGAAEILSRPLFCISVYNLKREMTYKKESRATRVPRRCVRTVVYSHLRNESPFFSERQVKFLHLSGH